MLVTTQITVLSYKTLFPICLCCYRHVLRSFLIFVRSTLAAVPWFGLLVVGLTLRRPVHVALRCNYEACLFMCRDPFGPVFPGAVPVSRKIRFSDNMYEKFDFLTVGERP
jgi:hypothetical protein